MVYVIDWLFIFYIVVGGKVLDFYNLYGIDQWGVLQINGKLVRIEIFYNIDLMDKIEVIRVGDYKLLYGFIIGYWDGWYFLY